MILHDIFKSHQHKYYLYHCIGLYTAYWLFLVRINSTLSGEKPYKFIHCNKYFVLSNILKAPLTTHADKKPFQCILYYKIFSQKHHLTNHMRIHTGEIPCQCSHCDKTFAQNSNLLIHLKTHAKLMPCQQIWTQPTEGRRSS